MLHSPASSPRESIFSSAISAWRPRTATISFDRCEPEGSAAMCFRQSLSRRSPVCRTAPMPWPPAFKIISSNPSIRPRSFRASAHCAIADRRVRRLLARLRTLIDPPLRLPAAFTAVHRVSPSEIDEYEHVNNTVYLRWLDGVAWAHSAKLGLPMERCLALRRGMAVRHTRADYLEAALVDDTLLLATWIVACDARLRCSRRFEILRIADGKRVLDAEIDFFCLNLDTGKPCRFPGEFVQHYTVMPGVAAAYAA